MWARWLLLCVGLVTCNSHAETLWPQGKTVFFAQSQGDEMQAWQVDSSSGRINTQNVNDLNTPLGSTWKLFVYSYLVDTQAPDAPYQCQGQNSEEKYCCSKGQSIRRDQALLQSCGLYFEPKHLGLQDASWRAYWYQQRAPLWLTELSNLHEHTVLPVRNLLWGLQQIPTKPRAEAEQVLLNVWLRDDQQGSLQANASQLRGKTLTMPHPVDGKQRIGGMAGWTVHGDAFWFIGRGNSREVLKQSAHWLPALSSRWQAASNQGLQDACIEVDYLAFMTNPIVGIKEHKTGKAIYGGVLPTGKYSVYLKNGREVALQSDGNMQVFAQQQYYRLRARMDMNEYVARVLQREAATEPEQAAKALSIAIRSYALNEATGSGDCLLMRDTTLQQRVLTQAASPEAKHIAISTDKLVLEGAHGHFHANSSQANVLGWQQAVTWAKQGLGFKAILARAYPQASVVVHGSDLGERCVAMPQAQKWLATQHSKWHKTLQREAGYRPLKQAASICRLSRGTPYADVAANRVYVRRLHSEAEQITLAHEYLHLLFADHPNGRNEHYIEALAQRLVKGH